MKKSQFRLAFYLFFILLSLNAQEKKKFKVHTIAFYNLENLFDTINDTTKFDERSPIMEMKANRAEVYKKKCITWLVFLQILVQR
jgi:FPC/CPF motif-containing protein YcgG